MKELFKEKGLKITKQRIIIFDLINKLGNLATVKNIYNECKNNMDYSTVYRIINLFFDKGIIHKDFNDKNEIYFSIIEDHGHYIKCINCNKKEKIDYCPIDNIERKLESMGYKILNHTVQSDCLCEECKDNKTL